MGRLYNSSIYLCGQVENCDSPYSWRVELAEKLLQIEPSLRIWDPLIKPDWMLSLLADETIAYKYKHHILNHHNNDVNKEYGHQCFLVNKQIRKICKMLASKCDILIARLTSKFTWGSIDELERAIARGIPIFLWMPDGNISVYGISGITEKFNLIDYYVHNNVDSLLDTISRINKDELDLPELDQDTWLYLTWKNAR